MRISSTFGTLLLILALLPNGVACEGPCVDPWGRSCESELLPPIDEVNIPGGVFQMGCNDALDGACLPNEGPQHPVDVPAFAIDRTEVPVSSYLAFLAAEGDEACGPETPCMNPLVTGFPLVPARDGWSTGPEEEMRPMRAVTWHGAVAFCDWMAQSLCTEAQWAKAARGGCERYEDCAAETPTYPWGESAPTCAHASFNEGGHGCGTGRAEEVGARPAGASPYGALDMAGNVWEWVRDAHHPDYSGAPDDGSAWEDPPSSWRIIRGGGGLGVAKDLRGAIRGEGGPLDASEWRGFRCCR